MKCPTVGRGNL
jgi:hypothetical protein